MQNLPRFSPLCELASAKNFRFPTAQATQDRLLGASADTAQHVKRNMFRTGLCDCPGPGEGAALISGWIHCFPPGENAHLLV